MATGTLQTHPLILRVKRKREEDPAEALLISSSKHVKVDPLSSDTDVSESTFRFAGTLSSSSVSEELIMEKVRGHSKLVKLNPLANLSLEESKQVRREKNMVNRREHRYKMVTQQRSLPEISEPSAQTLKILDFEPDSPLPPASVVVASPTKSEITCNNVTMTRQNTEQKGDPEQFVYDLYYTQDSRTIDWESAYIRECGVELVHDVFDPDDFCYEDDDDDSNDENNWRNDYPDEDDLSPTGSYGDSEDEYHDEYRHRKTNYDDDSFDDFFR